MTYVLGASVQAVREAPLRIVDGHAIVPGRPGNGLAWNEDAIRRYRMN